MAKLTIHNIDASSKEVLLRADFNVPLKDAKITDQTRIVATIPTIKKLIDQKARLVICSHLGRPDGKINPDYSLKPVAEALQKLLPKTKVTLAPDCIGDKTSELRNQLKEGEILLLENTRFHAEEENNDPEFAKALAGNADFFVNDAFGTTHRAHASTEGVTHFIQQNAMGLLVEKEMEYLVKQLHNPKRPFLVIIGGSKVSDKIEVINSLIDKADTFLIGGAMAYTFRKAQGHAVGKSRVEGDKLQLALDLIKKAQRNGVKFLLPADTRITQEFKEGATTQVTSRYDDEENPGSIPDDWEGIDIGDIAIEEFTKEIKKAKTILWNGPMGVFELNSFDKGTRAVAQAIADSDALSIIGGGDSVTAINKFKLEDKMSFISTGGGASLELLEGKTLPGINALTSVVQKTILNSIDLTQFKTENSIKKDL